MEKDQIFRLDLDDAKGDNTRVMLPHPEIIAASEIGHVLLVDDGKVKLTVVGKGDNDEYLDCRVDVPGKISNRKVSMRRAPSTSVKKFCDLILFIILTFPFIRSPGS